MSRPSPYAPLLLVMTAMACGPPPSEVPPRWEIVATGVEGSFRGMSAAGAGIVWASGTAGTVLRSLDGGATWQSIVVPGAEELDLRDIEAFGADEAVAVSAGHPARFFVTADGGDSWRVTHEDLRQGIFFDAMAFWDRRHGIAFGDPIDGRFTVVTTEDGGESWHSVAADALPPALEGEAGFAASGSCLTVLGDGAVWFGTGGAAARVFRSSDHGRTWSVADTPLAHGEGSQGIFSIAFVDARRGVAVGGDYRQPEVVDGNIAFTTDGGRTWQAPEAVPGGFRSAVRYLGADGRTLLTVGSHGADLSRDGGTSWISLGERGFHAIAVSPGPEGFDAWAIGGDGVVGRLRSPAPH